MNTTTPKEVLTIPVKDFEGLYTISDNGVLLPCLKEWVSGKGCKRTNKNRIKPMGSRDDKGYIIASLSNGSIKKTFKVHRLVAGAFIPNPENKPYVNHKNGIKHDNRVENLEWCTPLENNLHAVKIGLCDSYLGNNNNKSKIKESDVIIIRNSRLNNTELSKLYSVSRTAIRKIKNRQSWKHL